MDDVKGEFILVLPDKDNYPVVKLFIDGEEKTLKVHRLVASAFGTNTDPEKFTEVDHVDRNHWNSDKTNLEFVTPKENIRRFLKLREIEKAVVCNYSSGSKNYNNRYSDLQIIQVCIRLMRNEKVSKISRSTNVDTRTIYLIKSYKIWKNISCYFSFHYDGIIDETVYDKIVDMVKNGYSIKIILHTLNLPYEKNIIDTFNDLIEVIKEDLKIND